MKAKACSGRGARLEDKADRLGDALAFWALAAFGIVLLFGSYWIPAARKLEDLREEEAVLRSEIRKISERNEDLDRRLDALYNDPYFLERVLRKDQGFLPEGEKPVDPGERKVRTVE